jgi:hypothetical protein
MACNLIPGLTRFYGLGTFPERYANIGVCCEETNRQRCTGRDAERRLERRITVLPQCLTHTRGGVEQDTKVVLFQRYVVCSCAYNMFT